MLSSVHVFIIFSLITTVAYLAGLLTYFADSDENKCEMTYMFEYPQFVKISTVFDTEFPKYELFAYSEGRNTERSRRMYFDGIPVLFVPGNGGSFKQVRSLASIALRKSINSRFPYHFDYFSVSLNGELSGLSGFLLDDQMDYVNRSLHLILQLYEHRKHRPTSVVLIGHSMGGVIIRKLAQKKNNSINIVITLASPQKRAPILLDHYSQTFYENISDPVDENVTFVSVSGGYSDLLVPTTLTDLREPNGIYTVTTQIPMCWVSTDHLSIMWCKQALMVLTRCLFDSVDLKLKQISNNKQLRKRAFEHHLIKHNGIRVHRSEYYNRTVTIEGDSKWVENLARQYSIRLLHGVKNLHWYMVRIVNDPKHEMLTLVALNLEIVDWVYACGAHIPRGTYRTCDEAIHLTPLSNISPSVRYKRRSLTINMQELKKSHNHLTHVVFKALPTEEPVVFHVDVYNEARRTVQIKLPVWWSTSKHVIINQTAQKAITYQLLLPDLVHVVQSFSLYVEPIECTAETHHAAAVLSVPWGNEDTVKFFTDIKHGPFQLRLYNSIPHGRNESAVVKLTLDPTCRYRISIRRSILGTLSQLARFYTPLLAVNISVVVLLMVKTQLESLGSSKGCLQFFVALKSATKPFYVFIGAKVATMLISVHPLTRILPTTDWALLKEDGTDFFLLPYLMYTISLGIVWIFASCIIICITLCESTVHKLILKFVAQTLSFAVNWSDYVISALQKVPFVVAGLLIVISFSTCGGLAIALGTIFYFLKCTCMVFKICDCSNCPTETNRNSQESLLTQMSQDYIEDFIFKVVKGFIKKYKIGGKKQNKNEQSKTDNVNLGTVTDQIEETKVVKNGKATLVPHSEDSKEESNFESKTEKVVPEECGDNPNGICNEPDKKNDESPRVKEIIAIYDNIPIRNESRNENKTDVDDARPGSSVEKLPEFDNKVSRKELSERTNDDAEVKIKGAATEANSTDNIRNALSFHGAIFLLWVILTVINIPSVITWARNYKYNAVLRPDPSFIPGIVLSACALPLWQLDLPNVRKKWYEELSHIINVIVIVSLVYAPIYLYRLNYLLSVVIVIIALQQLFAPTIATDENQEASEERQSYDNIKVKLE